MEKILLGAHVPMTKTQGYLIGSVETTVKQGANTFMIFTGAPQNSKRTEVDLLGIEVMKSQLLSHQIDISHLVVHAPYLINLANTLSQENWKFSVDFLISEIRRSEAMGINLIVLHPGSTLGQDRGDSLEHLITALNQVISRTKSCVIALETMSGRKNELGNTLEELAYILKRVNNPQRLGICLDTCHLHDAGYNLAQWEEFKKQIDVTVGLPTVKVIHLNDSQNACGSHKDRHENIGYGQIGFENLIRIAWDPTFEAVPKILETPLKKTKSAHQMEIKAIRNRTFIDFLN